MTDNTEVQDLPVAPVAPVEETISSQDKSVLDAAAANKKTTLLQAQNAELQYNNIVLQLYVKHGMTNADALDDKGVVHRNVGAQK